MSETISPVEEMGFSAEEVELLREAGLLGDERVLHPWQPTTLEDVDWLAYRMIELDREAAAIQAQAEVRIKRLRAAKEALLSRYGDAMQMVTAQALPRNPKTGKVTRKSVDLERVRLGFRTVASGPKVVDPEAVLAFMRDRVMAELAEAPYRLEYSPETTRLGEALQATVRHTGRPALEFLIDRPEGVAVTIQAAPLKQYVASLPAVPDPDTGEALPATIPGVVIEPASERFYFEVPGGAK